MAGSTLVVGSALSTATASATASASLSSISIVSFMLSTIVR